MMRLVPTFLTSLLPHSSQNFINISHLKTEATKNLQIPKPALHLKERRLFIQMIQKITIFSLFLFLPKPFAKRLDKKKKILVVTFNCHFPREMTKEEFFKKRRTWQRINERIQINNRFIREKKILNISYQPSLKKHTTIITFDSEDSMKLWQSEISPKVVNMEKMKKSGFRLTKTYKYI